jgi:hypothetical protein
MTIIKTQDGNPVSASNQLPSRIYGVARTSNVGTQSNGSVSDLTLTSVGNLVNKPYSIPELDWQFACAAPVTTAVDTAAKAAGAAGIRNYVTNVQFINTGATATEVTVKDGSTVVWRGFAPANMTSMYDCHFLTPLKGTAATAMNFGVVTAGGNVYFNLQGYQAP